MIALMPNPRFELTRHGMRQSPSGVRFAHFTPLAAFRYLPQVQVDARSNLKAGLMDAGEAVSNLKVVAKAVSPQGFLGMVNIGRSAHLARRADVTIGDDKCAHLHPFHLVHALPPILSKC